MLAESQRFGAKIFGATRAAAVGTLDYVPNWTTYQDFIDAAIRKAGSQSELARRVSELLPRGQKLTPQAIQYLASRKARKKDGKPAGGSTFTPFIEQATGLAYANEGRLSASIGEVTLAATGTLGTLEPAQEIGGVELTKDAIRVARAFMDLPRRRRDAILRAIETEALGETTAVADARVEHLRAPSEKKSKPKAGTQ